jgi:hypothetical protein
MILNLFYEEPEGDRWLPFDRYPRRLIRRLRYGKPVILGHRRVFLNLCAGLDRIGVRYRINDYRWATDHPSETVGIVGKAHVLDRIEWRNPILFGAAVFSHPSDDPRLLERRPVRKILLPGAWMKELWKPFWQDAIAVWPVGIDTQRWTPQPDREKTIDVLLYDKILWDRDHHQATLVDPIRQVLKEHGLSVAEIRYRHYREHEFRALLAQCRVMIFVSSQETQGIAYQETLSCDVPVFAWDVGGYWRDPEYYPDKVKFAPVTSVPYWDDRCGRKFSSFAEFRDRWPAFWGEVHSGRFFSPRAYILDNLTLEDCARRYVDHFASVSR